MQFEQFAASVAKVAEITRQDGSRIGNAYKTILARTSRSQSGDLDVSDEDRSNASKSLASIGISVYDKNGEYQDFGKTLDQLSEKWDNLSKSQQSYVAEQMAGKVSYARTYSNIRCLTWKVTISVKIQRWTRPRKDCK